MAGMHFGNIRLFFYKKVQELIKFLMKFIHDQKKLGIVFSRLQKCKMNNVFWKINGNEIQIIVIFKINLSNFIFKIFILIHLILHVH